MTFPSPVAFWIGSWPVHWYGLAYGAGIIAAWLYGRFCIAAGRFRGLSCQSLDGFINWAIVGMIVGGRLGQVLLYQPSYYFHHPLEIIQVWKGGMAFHGGIVGILVAMVIYSKHYNLSFFSFSDCWAMGTPIGLFFGRLANFVNQELYGKVTNVSWGIVFPSVDEQTRHPSQLYEAALEGVFLFILLNCFLWRRSRRPGIISGVFLMGYGMVRWFSEYFRESSSLEYSWGLSFGQLYSVPLILLGFIFCMVAWRRHDDKSILSVSSINN